MTAFVHRGTQVSFGSVAAPEKNRDASRKDAA